jgi:SAM-dependent methyltransferase
MSVGSLLDGYDVVVCAACGFAFADNLPDQAAFDRYYRDMSKYENQERKGQLPDFNIRRYRETVGIIMKCLPQKTARILDVGCATGGLLDELKQNGYDQLTGLDPSPACAQTAANLYGIKVLTKSLSETKKDIGIFNLIILCAVLEHIHDLKFTLSRVRALLSSGGIVYIEVPDAAHFTCSDRDSPFQEFSTEHINFFSASSLSNLMQSHGFKKIFLREGSFEQSSGIIVHDIKTVFRREDEVKSRTLLRDTETERNLVTYISRSQDIEKRMIKVIDAVVADGRPIIVWGVGTLTQRLLLSSRLAEATIRSYVDSNPKYQGKQMNKIPIIAPSELKGKTEPILISSVVFQEEIESQIRNDLALSNEIIKLS